MYRLNASEVDYEEVTVFDHTMIYAECRINRDSIPKGMYMYEVRHNSEDWSEPCEIADRIVVNFAGTLISNRPFVMGPERSIRLNFYDDWNYEGVSMSLGEYMSHHPPQKNKKERER